MPIFAGSRIAIRRNRFRETGSKYEETIINKINIGKSFNSINYKKFSFTNFVNSPKQKVYEIVSRIYNKAINNIETIVKEFTFDEIYYSGEVTNRLLILINKTNNSNYTSGDLPNIYKLKNNKEPKIHLYMEIIGNDALILLINLYHLSIPGDLYLKHRLIKK